MRRASWLICLLLLSAAAQPIWAEKPPTDLHLVDDHWTAWDPPDTVPEGAQVYIIERGDTLWDLSARFLGDPYLWPQIWEQNQYILDAHWIYPGDPLILTGAALAEAFAEPEDVAGPPLGEAVDEGPFAPPTEDTGIAPPPATAPVPLGYESDIYCTGFVGEVDEEFPFRIAGSEYEFLAPTLARGHGVTEGEFGKSDTVKYGLGLGDIAYIDGGRADGLSTGELLTAVKPGPRLRHPDTGDLVGRAYVFLGRVRVLSTQEETAIAEIVQLCSPIQVGSALRYFEPVPVPLRRMTPMRPPNYPAKYEDLENAPTIITSVENLIAEVGEYATLSRPALADGFLVFIDHGATQDVVPGDVYTIYRRNRPGYPPTVLGELGVLSVFENASLARILRSRYTIHIGDPLQLK